MNAWAKRGLQAAFFTGGMLAFGAGIASATECCPDRPTPPLAAPVSIPLHICDNAIGTPLGTSQTPCVDHTVSSDQALEGAESTGVLRAEPVARAKETLRGNAGRLNVLVPVHVAGNAIAAGGDVRAESSSRLAMHNPEPIRVDRSDGMGAGNVVAGDWVAPVAVTGNAVGLAGDAVAVSSTTTEASSGGDVYVDGPGEAGSGNVFAPAFATPVQLSGNAVAAPAGTAAAAGQHAIAAEAGGDIGTTGADSPFSGNVDAVPLGLPAQVNGNAVGWVGTAYSEADADGYARAGGDTVTNGAPTQGSGNVSATALAGPVAISGNAISWIANTEVAGAQHTAVTAGGEYGTTGQHGVLSGNITEAAGAVPVQVLGNSVTWIGISDAGYQDGTASTAGGRHSTTGTGSVGSGDVVSVPFAGPVQLAGNAVSWIADSSTESITDAQTMAGGDSATNGDHSILGSGIADLPMALPVQGFGNGLSWIGTAEARHDNAVAADAGGDSYTGGDCSALGGPMTSGPVAGPVDVFGNGASWIGTASGASLNSSSAQAGGFQGTSGSGAMVGGQIVQTPVALPAQAMGNAGSWIGTAEGVASNQKWSYAGGPPDSNDDGGLLSSNILTTPVAGPVELFGNGAGWIADVTGAADSQTTSTAGGSVDATGTGGVGSGNVAAAPLAMPAQVFGDAVTWIGDGRATASGATTSTAGGDVVTDGSDGTLDGNVAAPSLAGAAQVFGDAASWLGIADGAASNATVTTAGGSVDTAGTRGMLSGNVSHLPAMAAVQPFGTAAALIAGADGAADSVTALGSGGPVATDGTDASLSGNIASTPTAAVFQAFGNALALPAAVAGGEGVNVTGTVAGGETTTAGDGFLNGTDLLAPAGGLTQVYGVPIEVLGQAFTAAANSTVMVTGESVPLVAIGISGNALPTTGLFPGRDDDAGRSHPSAPSGMPNVPGLSGLSGLEDMSLPSTSGLGVLPVEEMMVMALNGLGLPDVGRMPAAPPLPDTRALDFLPTSDGIDLPAADALPVPSTGDVPGLDALAVPSLPSMGELPNLPVEALLSPDTLPVPSLPAGALPDLPVEALLRPDTLAVPSLPSMGELPDLEGPARACAEAVDSLAVPSLPSMGELPSLEGPAQACVEAVDSLGAPSLPSTDGLTLPSVPALPSADALPSVPALPADALPSSLPSLPSTDALPNHDGLVQACADAVEGLAVPSLPAPSGLPTLNGLTLPSIDSLPGANGVPGFDGLAGPDCMPGAEGLYGVTELPNLEALTLPSMPVDTGSPVASAGLPSTAALPNLNGVSSDCVTAVKAIAQQPDGRTWDEFDLPEFPPGAAPTPRPLDLPDFGALPTDQLPAIDGLGGTDPIVQLITDIDELADMPTT